MAAEVYMDIPQVEKMSKEFQTFGSILDGVARTLELIANLLRETAWCSFGVTGAMAMYIERIKPNFKNAASKMREISNDISSAIRAYRDGDHSGSTHFT